jgi:hypothetical protein
MTQTPVHFHWHDPKTAQRFRTAVSLHSHTLHSHEGLEFVPRIAQTIPGLREAVALQERSYARKHGHKIDYSAAYWTPPLSEREALRLESSQIENLLALKPLVSLSDHDNIDAALHLQLFEKSREAVVSVEWTVPYLQSFFHLGVHNLPREFAAVWMARFRAFTTNADPATLHELLAELARERQVLIILNHPLWDEKGLGAARHRAILTDFLARNGEWIHALELNGMRSWAENLAVQRLAHETGYCVISGGDRHGSDANANVNLTDAADFNQFVDEVRRDRVSHVLMLPHYRAPFRQRYAEAVWDVMREYPEHTGRVRWTDRFFFRTESGEYSTLASAWQGGDGPGIIGVFMACLRLMGSERMRWTLRAAFGSREEVQP